MGRAVARHNVNNGGGVDAFWQPLHRMPATARVVIPANSFLVFVR